MRDITYVSNPFLNRGKCSRGFFTLYSFRARLVSRGYLENKLYATHASLYTEPVSDGTSFVCNYYEYYMYLRTKIPILWFKILFFGFKNSKVKNILKFYPIKCLNLFVPYLLLVKIINVQLRVRKQIGFCSYSKISGVVNELLSLISHVKLIGTTERGRHNLQASCTSNYFDRDLFSHRTP